MWPSQKQNKNQYFNTEQLKKKYCQLKPIIASSFAPTPHPLSWDKLLRIYGLMMSPGRWGRRFYSFCWKRSLTGSDLINLLTPAPWRPVSLMSESWHFSIARCWQFKWAAFSSPSFGPRSQLPQPDPHPISNPLSQRGRCANKRGWKMIWRHLFCTLINH